MDFLSHQYYVLGTNRLPLKILTVLRFARVALRRAPHISRTPRDVDKILQWCCHVTYILPATRDTIFLSFVLPATYAHVP